MKVKVAKGEAIRRVGARAGGVQFHLKWPGGLFRASWRSGTGKTAAELERRLSELDPDQLERLTIRAIVPVRGKAGGRRWAHVASWRPAGKESLPAFVARSIREAADLPGTVLPVLEDAWIDESDL